MFTTDDLKTEKIETKMELKEELFSEEEDPFEDAVGILDTTSDDSDGESAPIPLTMSDELRRKKITRLCKHISSAERKIRRRQERRNTQRRRRKKRGPTPKGETPTQDRLKRRQGKWGPGFKRKADPEEDWHAIATGFGHKKKKSKTQEQAGDENDWHDRWRTQGKPYYGRDVKRLTPSTLGNTGPDPESKMAPRERMIELLEKRLTMERSERGRLLLEVEEGKMRTINPEDRICGATKILSLILFLS